MYENLLVVLSCSKNISFYIIRFNILYNLLENKTDIVKKYFITIVCCTICIKNIKRNSQKKYEYGSIFLSLEISAILIFPLFHLYDVLLKSILRCISM